MSVSNIEIVDAAHALFDEWQRQRLHSTEAEMALCEKYGVTDLESIGEEGYIFQINGVEYGSSWSAEVERADTNEGLPRYSYTVDTVTELPMTDDEKAALAFAREYECLIQSSYSAVHATGNHLGWWNTDDDECEGTYVHPDSDVAIIVPHWCTKFGRIRFREVL